jgi:hypothetical protein
MKRWKDWAALRKPKGILGYSNNPKEVMTAVFYVGRVNGNEMECADQVEFGEERFVVESGGDVENVWEGVAIGLCN